MKHLKATILVASVVILFIGAVVTYERLKRAEVRRKQSLFCSFIRSRVLNSLNQGIPLHIAEDNAVREARYNTEMSASEVNSWNVSYNDVTENTENPCMEIIFHYPEYNIKRITILYSPSLREMLPKISR